MGVLSHTIDSMASFGGRDTVLTLERKSWDKGDCWNAGQVLERSSGWLKVGVRTLLERC